MFKVNVFLVLFLVSAAVVFTACTAETTSPQPSPAQAPKSQSENPAIVIDRTGREWDVTHARDVYSMNPDYFNYGLGVGAIPSVDKPTVLEEGNPDYPSANSRTPVFGVDHNGEQRAYSISALTQHEVFNDIYPGNTNQYVAVTY
jgi:ABC-type Fe3+-hydroxamate transport system substrate-binding protein